MNHDKFKNEKKSNKKENETRQKSWATKKTRSRSHGEGEENWRSWKNGMILNGQKNGSRRKVLAGMLPFGFTEEAFPFYSSSL